MPSSSLLSLQYDYAKIQKNKYNYNCAYGVYVIVPFAYFLAKSVQ